jgi:hypothetical protein
VVDLIIAAFTGFAKSDGHMLIRSNRMERRKDKQERYRAYILRCWQEGKTRADQEPLWRFSVEEVFDERVVQGFGSLEELIAFLRVELVGPNHK